MRIGIDGRYLSHIDVGLGKYTFELLRALLEIDRDNSYVIFHQTSLPDGLKSAPNLSQVKHYHCPLPIDLLEKITWEQTIRVQKVMKDIDVMHFPYLAYSHQKKAKVVVTIHDVAHHHYSHYQGGIFRKAYLSYIDSIVHKADQCITDSEYSKGEIERYLNISKERIKVIPLAAHKAFKPIKDEDKRQFIKTKYSLPDQFIFYMGGFDVRKNVANLLKAYAAMNRNDYPLVLAGKIPVDRRLINRGAYLDIRDLAKHLKIGNYLHLPGPIEEQDLPAVLSSAFLVVYPSLYEGFGLPVLEAMSCGTPVVASRTSSLPEIINRDDLLFDPFSVDDIQKKIRSVLENKLLAQEISHWAYKRSRDYSWEKVARETLALYEMLSG